MIGVDGRLKLYETGPISNADVAFGSIVAPELQALRDGRGITREEYKRAAADQPKAEGLAAPLEGRARKIADAMPCPCGCTGQGVGNLRANRLPAGGAAVSRVPDRRGLYLAGTGTYAGLVCGFWFLVADYKLRRRFQ